MTNIDTPLAHGSPPRRMQFTILKNTLIHIYTIYLICSEVEKISIKK